MADQKTARQNMSSTKRVSKVANQPKLREVRGDLPPAPEGQGSDAKKQDKGESVVSTTPPQSGTPKQASEDATLPKQSVPSATQTERLEDELDEAEAREQVSASKFQRLKESIWGIPEKPVPEDEDWVFQTEANELKDEIRRLYQEIPKELRDQPEVVVNCLDQLFEAENSVSKAKSDSELIKTRRILADVELELHKKKNRAFSFTIVTAVLYLFIGFAVFVATFDFIPLREPAEQLNDRMFLGVPAPVWFWAAIGSLTSMLFRAGQEPFTNRLEALRWLLYRPAVGIVMGALAYLMVVTGLIVFAGQSTTQTPQLIWVIAFIGAFSDTISITLLQKVIGQFQIKDKEQKSSRPANKKKK